MKLLLPVTILAVLAASAPTGDNISTSIAKREVGEVSTDYIFTDDPAAGGKVGQKKKRESGEVSTDYIFTDDPAAGGKVGQ
ncbi:hypothetical protein CH063_13531 [Colletotrichum higginsianum]|nr:hypothetical protein CH063_13531 [Colletotrichum higginsianum]